MNFLSKYKNIILIVIAIIGCIILSYFVNKYKTINTLSIAKNYKKQEIVISRYNENLQWIKNEPFNKHPVIVYNKGINNNYVNTSNIIKTVNLPNVGRESHTYLYHIINNYHNLADVTIFLPGSSDLINKYDRVKKMVEKVEQTNNTVLSCVYDPLILKNQYNFTIDEYFSSHVDNKHINQNGIIKKSSIRPYGKWFEKTFVNGEKNEYVSYCGIISISKKNILQKPKKYYEKLLNELDTHHNPEVGHYLERSWYSIFYPYDSSSTFLTN
uniref:Uncharacterized protein n=1 Tax=viral metagenome TaxID=1070528 RepID=A0A6C0EF39_9ZZZZ